MSTTPPCSCTPDCDGSAADTADPATGGSPFARVRFNDGMLLGAADLRVEQNGHLWRDRLHQALLHGAGTVWGLAVRRSTNARQLQVEPGLAVDARGRNLYVTNTLCLDVSALGAATLATFPAAEEGRRRAWVVIRYEPCAKEPVSALRPTCAEAPANPAWSREIDSIRVDLVGEEPEEPIVTLRRFLERTGVAPDLGPGRWVGGVPTATELRALLLEIALGPTLPGDRDRRLLADLWMGDDPLPLVLAEVELVSDGTIVTVAEDPRNEVRALLPSTQLMAELLFGVPLAGKVRGAATGIVLERIQVVGGLVDLTFNAAIEPASATTSSAALLTWDGTAWAPVPLTVSVLDRSLTLTPTAAIPAGQPVQVILRGVGQDALVGVGGLPFAGESGPSPLPIARDLALVATWS